MIVANLLPGVSSSKVATSRLGTHLLSSGAPDGQTVVFLHGNVSSSRLFEETLVAMPPRYRCLAPDLRGYGSSDHIPIDATRGLRDFSDDLFALLQHPQVLSPKPKVHLVGWFEGSGVAMQFAIDHPKRVLSLTLITPLSPYGFGGTKGLEGTPCWPDFAGSGGGIVHSEFVDRLVAKDSSGENAFSPRQVLNQFFLKPHFRLAPEREDVLVSAMLEMALGEEAFPGDSKPSPHWPGMAPGTRGMNNAISGRYCNLSPFIQISPRPPVLWIRGAEDRIVSDTSVSCFGQLGKLGLVPGWPGEDVFPPQPMVGQTRAVLDAYRVRGGSVREEVLPGVGHLPHLEAPEHFRSLLLGFLDGLTP